MVKQLLFVLLVSSFAFKTLAQCHPFFDVYENAERYIFTDKAFVRANPNITASVVDTLSLGDIVVLAERLRDSIYKDEERNITARWGKVNYKKNGEEREGYLWTGQMSMPPLRRGSMKFIYGVDSMVEKEFEAVPGHPYPAMVHYMKIKAVEDGKVIAEDTFSTIRLGSLTRTSVSGGKGLKNIKYITSLQLVGQHCGATHTTFTHLWNGECFTILPICSNGGDVDYTHNETFTFPADEGGEKGRVIWTMEETIFEQIGDDYSKEGEKIRFARYLYRWDGKNIY